MFIEPLTVTLQADAFFLSSTCAPSVWSVLFVLHPLQRRISDVSSPLTSIQPSLPPLPPFLPYLPLQCNGLIAETLNVFDQQTNNTTDALRLTGANGFTPQAPFSWDFRKHFSPAPLRPPSLPLSLSLWLYFSLSFTSWLCPLCDSPIVLPFDWKGYDVLGWKRKRERKKKWGSAESFYSELKHPQAGMCVYVSVCVCVRGGMVWKKQGESSNHGV